MVRVTLDIQLFINHRLSLHCVKLVAWCALYGRCICLVCRGLLRTGV